MCIIVDANSIGGVLGDPADPDGAPVRRWIERGRGRIVYSTEGRFGSEIVGRAKAKLQEYHRAGKARFVPYDEFRETEIRLLEDWRLRSNDSHVIALAKAERVRLLYTRDAALMNDFKDKRIIKKGKVYSGRRNRSLLDRSSCR